AGDVRSAIDHAERSWTAALQGGDPWITTSAAIWPLTWWPWLGDRTWWERWLNRYFEYRKRALVGRYDRPAFGAAALLAAWLGRPDQAETALRAAAEFDARQPNRHPFLEHLAGAAHAALGNWEQARAVFRQTLEVCENSSCQKWGIEVAAHYGRFLLRAGDLVTAESLLNQAYRTARDGRCLVQIINLLPLLGELRQRRGQLDEADRCLREARSILSQPQPWQGLTAAVDRAEGLLATANEEWSSAERCFTRALEAEQACGFLFNEAHILVPWAEVYFHRDEPSDAERGLDKLDRALAIFEQCQAQKDMEKVLARRAEVAS
ncbi:MAG: hypothetical protein HY329_14615, partial [Chloroflexi bacterium]|nr:hypothetical protein [Chloroflexota bacterium]